jgi:hypothetical protein
MLLITFIRGKEKDQDYRIFTKNEKRKTKNGSSSCDQA